MDFKNELEKHLKKNGVFKFELAGELEITPNRFSVLLRNINKEKFEKWKQLIEQIAERKRME